MTDRELLELSAKAAGLKINAKRQAERDAIIDPVQASLWISGVSTAWNPLIDDGDALRLAVKLRLLLNREINCDHDIVEVFGPEREDLSRHCSTEGIGTDPYAATRRAIVRAAVEIGRIKQ